jgi:hypothetical protein
MHGDTYSVESTRGPRMNKVIAFSWCRLEEPLSAFCRMQHFAINVLSHLQQCIMMLYGSCVRTLPSRKYSDCL